MTYVSSFILGSAIGSFLNVVSLRYNRSETTNLSESTNNFASCYGGRSRCMYCQKTLSWYELIPLFSFLIQKGKCRSCGNRLSWQYPLVELLSGLIFVFVLLRFNLQSTNYYLQTINYNPQQLLVIGCWLLIFILFLLLSIIDFRHYIIPDSINLFLAILGAVIILQSIIYKLPTTNSFLGHYSLLLTPNYKLQTTNYGLFLNHFFAAFIAMAFVAAIIILSRGRGMGWGDFKLVGALGLIFGWPDILMLLFLSFIVGSIFVLPLLIRKQKTMKDFVPFGPFLVIAASLTFFLGYQIIDSYFKLFSFV